MLGMIKQNVRKFVQRLGYDISPFFPADFDETIIKTYGQVKPYTMTTKERVFALCQSVEYVAKHNIPGAIVECGVWKGGSMMAVAKTLLRVGAADRTLYLFDTFSGMSEPSAVDRNRDGIAASDLLKRSSMQKAVWACSHLEEVKRAMSITGYDNERLVFVEGKVEETVPEQAPNTIALLRLDTDWYESTRHELVHLYPRLAIGGVLIIDDYGDWEGARRAVDEYLDQHNLKLLLNRIDSTGRICVKLED
jgi:O-methyltransferase